MERAVRIAVVGAVDDRVVGDLRALPLAPEVRPFQSLFHDTEAIARFQPDVLVTRCQDPAEDVGALRLLHGLWPALAVVLIADAAAEPTWAPHARRIGAQLLVTPEKPGHLAAVVEQALQGSDRPRAEVFVDLAHGIADEINNPLLFVSGHLQLLRAGFDPAAERDRRDQVAAALDGVQRIQESVDRLRQLSQATNGPRRPERVDLDELLRQATTRVTAAATARATFVFAGGPCEVVGDREQLQAAIAAVTRFADELAATGTRASLQLESHERARRLRLLASGGDLHGWRLPHTFEPYYPNRILRGGGHGLNLFLAQTVVLGHRGQALARRTADGSLQIDFVLPA
jgi:signal transduction histidine kinase